MIRGKCSETRRMLEDEDTNESFGRSCNATETEREEL